MTMETTLEKQNPASLEFLTERTNSCGNQRKLNQASSVAPYSTARP